MNTDKGLKKDKLIIFKCGKMIHVCSLNLIIIKGNRGHLIRQDLGVVHYGLFRLRKEWKERRKGIHSRGRGGVKDT